MNESDGVGWNVGSEMCVFRLHYFLLVHGIIYLTGGEAIKRRRPEFVQIEFEKLQPNRKCPHCATDAHSCKTYNDCYKSNQGNGGNNINNDTSSASPLFDLFGSASLCHSGAETSSNLLDLETG